jgi:hypothetical protein
MAIHKLKKHQNEIPYEMVSREVAQSITNPNALAIWLYLLTKPEDWTVRRNDIKNHFGIGDQSYSKAMNYLYDNKLCKREVIQDESGKIANTVIHVHSTPYEEIAVLPENPQHGETVIRETSKLTENRVITENDTGTKIDDTGMSSIPYPNCPHKELLDMWQRIIPETTQHNPHEWTSGRAGYTNLAKKWKAGFVTKRTDGTPVYTDKESGLKWWEGFMRYMRQSDFLINNCRPFCLEWAVKPANFNKIKEGTYHDR